MKKRILSLLLVLCLVCSLLPGVAFAKGSFDYEVNGFNLICFDDGKSITINGCRNATTASGDLVIPSSIQGKPVTMILDGAFGEGGGNPYGTCSNLTSITIPDSVTEIGIYAFNSCENLR